MAHVLHRGGETPAAEGVVKGAGRFGLHLFEMCMAMCVGVAVLDVPFVGLAKWAGYADPIRDLPQLAAVVVAFNMSLPMALWMRYRGHDWRCVKEMSGAMFAEAFVLIVVAWLGAFATTSLVPLQHSLMIPAMVIVMLFRLDVYTAPTHHGTPATA